MKYILIRLYFDKRLVFSRIGFYISNMAIDSWDMKVEKFDYIFTHDEFFLYTFFSCLYFLISFV